MNAFLKYILFYVILVNLCFLQKIIIPMDNSQNDHLKAYGLVYSMLNKNNNVEWLLNYKGGAFFTRLPRYLI